LADAVAKGRFREDLFARLNGYEITLPELRERREDIALLFRHFLTSAFPGKAPRFGARVVEALSVHGWPQNVRELENLAQRFAVLHPEATEVELDRLSLTPQTHDEEGAPVTPLGGEAEHPDAQPQELRKLLSALSARDGNVVRVAEELGISRARAYRWIAAAGIDVQRFRKRAPFRS
jgi:DNA-binding NtrC family response regulator